ncbi:MAG: putative lysozyme [Pseudonocardia sp.]|nr:putative lysozyme [Pseudonocardia sp.]
MVPGDTLAGIALRHNVPFDQLASRNGIRDPNKIMAGTKLSIGKRVPGTEVIQPGDGLRTYAQRYGVSEEKLTVLNPQLLEPPGLLVGAEIRIAAATS